MSWVWGSKVGVTQDDHRDIKGSPGHYGGLGLYVLRTTRLYNPYLLFSRFLPCVHEHDDGDDDDDDDILFVVVIVLGVTKTLNTKTSLRPVIKPRGQHLKIAG